MFTILRHFITALLTTALLAIPASVKAQENFIEGFVISNEGDTIRGQIDYQNWVMNPTEIQFRSKEGGVSTLNTLSVLGFKVADEFYRSAYVQIETSPYLTNQLNDIASFRLEKRNVFLQAQILGTKSLYYLNDENSKDQFYIEVDGEFQLLLYKKYLEGRLLMHNRTYRGQLATYLSDCDNASTWVKSVPYNKRSLSQLFNKYYQCTSGKSAFTKEVEKLKTQFGALAGFSFTNVQFSSTTFNELALTDFSQSTNVALGLSAEIILARDLQRWTIQNELFYSSYAIEGSVAIYNSSNFSTTTYNNELAYSYIKLNNMLRYHHRLNAMTLFIGAGIANGFAISETNYQSRDLELFNNVRTVEDVAINETRTYEQSLLVGVGIRRGPYTMELRHERGNGMSNGNGLSSLAKRLFVLFAYRF